jgi:hypothetical protein
MPTECSRTLLAKSNKAQNFLISADVRKFQLTSENCGKTDAGQGGDERVTVKGEGTLKPEDTFEPAEAAVVKVEDRRR